MSELARRYVLSSNARGPTFTFYYPTPRGGSCKRTIRRMEVGRPTAPSALAPCRKSWRHHVLHVRNGPVSQRTDFVWRQHPPRSDPIRACGFRLGPPQAIALLRYGLFDRFRIVSLTPIGESVARISDRCDTVSSSPTCLVRDRRFRRRKASRVRLFVLTRCTAIHATASDPSKAMP